MSVPTRAVRALPASLSHPSLPSQKRRPSNAGTAAAAASSLAPPNAFPSPSKRAKLSPPPPSTAFAPSGGVFGGCVVLLLPGEDLTAGRRALLSAQIVKRGGRTSAVLGADVTHVVVPSDYRGSDYAGWRDRLSEARLDALHVRTVSWLVESLRRGSLAVGERFAVAWRDRVPAAVPRGAAPASAAVAPQRQLLGAFDVGSDSFIPASPPLSSQSALPSSSFSLSQPPPLSPALSQQSLSPPRSPAHSFPSSLPIPTSTPTLSPSDALALSIPDSDSDTALPTPLSPSSHPSDPPDYLIDPSLHPLALPPLAPLTTPSQSVIPPHPYHHARRSKLACQQPSVALVNHNPHVTAVLERLEEINTGLGDKWRTYSYRKAVGIVKQFPRRIATEADLDEVGRIRGIGSKMKEKIREVMQTGTLSKMQHMEADERVQVMERFSKIHGVAGATAGKWSATGAVSGSEHRTAPLSIEGGRMRPSCTALTRASLVSLLRFARQVRHGPAHAQRRVVLPAHSAESAAEGRAAVLRGQAEAHPT